MNKNKRYFNKKNYKVLFISFLIIPAIGCSTTTINSGQGYEKQYPSAGEARLFTHLSEKDSAFNTSEKRKNAKKRKLIANRSVLCPVAVNTRVKTKSPQKNLITAEKKDQGTSLPVISRRSALQKKKELKKEEPTKKEPVKEEPKRVEIIVKSEKTKSTESEPEKKVKKHPASQESYFVTVAEKKSANDNPIYHRKARYVSNVSGKISKKKEKLFSDPHNDEFYQVGTASWYGRDFNGRKTASGEVFNSRKLTAAHKKLPLGTIVLVRNLENNNEVVLRINDRGPFIKGRIIDVSEYGAERLDFKGKGLTTVGIKIIRKGDVKVRAPGTTKSVYGRHDVNENKKQKPEVRKKSDNSVKNKETPSDVKKSVTKKIRVNKKEYKPENSLKGFSVQVGVFEHEFNAAAIKYALNKFKYPVFILKRGSLFIVKIGNFLERSPADELRDRLNDAGFTAFISTPVDD